MLGPFIPPSYAAYYMLNPRLRAADGVGWEETCAAWDASKAAERSFGRPPAEMNGHENRKHHFAHSPTHQNNSLTHG